MINPDGQLNVGIAVPGQPGQSPQMQTPATAPATAIAVQVRPAYTPMARIRQPTGDQRQQPRRHDDDMENWLSITAIEAELKPKVIETFDTVAGAYKRLRRLQDQDIQFQLKRLSLSPAQERKYKNPEERDHRRGEIATTESSADRRAGRASLRDQ